MRKIKKPRNLRLLGGQASTGPHTVDRKHDTMTRQRKRLQLRKAAMQSIRQQFGGRGRNSNGPCWPMDFPRKTARAIAHAKASIEGRRKAS